MVVYVNILCKQVFISLQKRIMVGCSATRDFISNLYIFKSENTRSLVSFAHSESHVEYFEKGREVIRENARSNDFGYVIMSGTADVYIE